MMLQDDFLAFYAMVKVSLHQKNVGRDIGNDGERKFKTAA
jgi:hypothetical protein